MCGPAWQGASFADSGKQAADSNLMALTLVFLLQAALVLTRSHLQQVSLGGLVCRQGRVSQPRG